VTNGLKSGFPVTHIPRHFL